MRPITVVVGPLAAASATNIRTASAIGGAGAVVLNGSTVSGGVATLDVARRVIFTSSGNDTGITFTVTGTSNTGNTRSEVVTGANAGAASTVLSYKTITSVVASGAAAGTVSIGTNGVAESPWVRLDDYAPAPTAIQCTASGTVNYTVQSSLDDPNTVSNNPNTGPGAGTVDGMTLAGMTWVNSSDTAAVGATGTIQSNFLFAPKFARILLNSGSGSVTATFLQSGSP